MPRADKRCSGCRNRNIQTDDDGRTRFVFVKGPDRAKIDAGIGAVLALEALAVMPVEEDSQPWAVFA